MAWEQAVVSPIVERQSLREQIVRSLRASVISGKLESGAVYSVPSLAAQFGISATPVREAMLELCRDGLVEPVRNKGFRISVMTDHQLDEITQLRALIEIPTAGAISEIVTPDQVDELAQLARKICVAAEAGDLVGYLESDREFHLSLLALSANEMLVHLVGELRMRTRLYGLPKLEREHRLNRSAEEHLELVEALRDRDRQLVEAIMRRHIGHVRNLWASNDDR